MNAIECTWWVNELLQTFEISGCCHSYTIIYIPMLLLLCSFQSLVKDRENPSKWNRQDDDSDWQVIDSGPVKRRDAAAAANGSCSDDQVAQVFTHGWNSGLNHIADQQAWSPSSRPGFLSSECLMASFHEISIVVASGAGIVQLSHTCIMPHYHAQNKILYIYKKSFIVVSSDRQYSFTVSSI